MHRGHLISFLGMAIQIFGLSLAQPFDLVVMAIGFPILIFGIFIVNREENLHLAEIESES